MITSDGETRVDGGCALEKPCVVEHDADRPFAFAVLLAVPACFGVSMPTQMCQRQRTMQKNALGC